MRFPVLSVLWLLAAVPVTAQDRGDRIQQYDEFDRQQPQPPRQVQSRADEQTGRTVDTGGGEVGQRQTRLQAAPNITPLGRIPTRIANRVQNRIRNRIDRYYDPQANATSPFRAADDRARTTSIPR